jgi:hypothetical protein
MVKMVMVVRVPPYISECGSFREVVEILVDAPCRGRSRSRTHVPSTWQDAESPCPAGRSVLFGCF